jgi:hypothetical protein
MQMLPDPQYKTADGAALRIWRDTAQNRFLSEKLGRPIFDEVIFVEVIAPGSGNSTPVFELERTFDENMGHPDPLRGAKYEELKQFVEDFKKAETGGGDGALSGTPLEQWPEMNRSLVATLKAQGVYTVDALASLPDGKLTIVGPDGRTWREKAKAYLENAKDGAYATELAAKLENLMTELSAGQEREKAMAARIQELENTQRTAATAPDISAKKLKTEKTAADAVAEIAAAQAVPVTGEELPII